MKTKTIGYIQAGFEARMGQPLAEWLADKGGMYSQAEATALIGYASHGALRTFVARYMPESFRFRREMPAMSDRLIRQALFLRESGMTPVEVSAEMGLDRQVIRDSCRRYLKRQSRFEKYGFSTARQPKLRRAEVAFALESRTAGMGDDWIADELNVSDQYIHALLSHCEVAGLEWIRR